MTLRELHYTSVSPDDGPSGFRFVSMSPGVGPALSEQIRTLAVYQPPAGAPVQPDDDQLSAFPVALSYTTLQNGSKVLCNVTYVGRDQTGRYGNFYAHAVHLPDEASGLGGRTAIETWRSPFWQRAWDGSDTPPERDVIAPGEETVLEPVADFASRQGARLAAFLEDVRKVLTSADGRQIVLVGPDVNETASWIAVACHSLPEAEAARLTFTTYTRTPSILPHHILGVAAKSDLEDASVRGRRYLVYGQGSASGTPGSPGTADTADTADTAGASATPETSAGGSWAALAARLWAAGRADLFGRVARSRASLGGDARPRDPFAEHAEWLAVFALAHGVPLEPGDAAVVSQWAYARGAGTPARFRTRLAEAAARNAAQLPLSLLLDLSATIAPPGAEDIRELLLTACVASLPGSLAGDDDDGTAVSRLVGSRGSEGGILNADAVEFLAAELVDAALARCVRAAGSASWPAVERLLRVVDRLDPDERVTDVESPPGSIVRALSAEKPEEAMAFLATTRHDAVRHGVLAHLDALLAGPLRAVAAGVVCGPAGRVLAGLDVARYPVLAAVLDVLRQPPPGAAWERAGGFKRLVLRLTGSERLDVAGACDLAHQVVWANRPFGLYDAEAVLDLAFIDQELFQAVLPACVEAVAAAEPSPNCREVVTAMLERYRSVLGPADTLVFRVSRNASRAAAAAGSLDDGPWVALAALLSGRAVVPPVLRRRAVALIVARLMDVPRLERLGESADQVLGAIVRGGVQDAVDLYLLRARETLPGLVAGRPNLIASCFCVWFDRQGTRPGSAWDQAGQLLAADVLGPVAARLSRVEQRQVGEHLAGIRSREWEWPPVWSRWLATNRGGRWRRPAADGRDRGAHGL